jgi:hypothetical protein
MFVTTQHSAGVQRVGRDARCKSSTPHRLQRPLIQYQVDDADGYVRKCFRKIVEVHQAVFDVMGITRRKLQLGNDSKPLTFGGSGHITGDQANGRKSRLCRRQGPPRLRPLTLLLLSAPNCWVIPAMSSA